MKWAPRCVLLAGLMAPGISISQVSLSLVDFARPTLKWQTIETEHFSIHFHQGSGERSAAEVARIAEEVYGPITELYGYHPRSKVSIIIKDYEDYSNGAAYFFDNKIEIWAPSLDSKFRGDHHWLENVIAHEFTHIVQVQAAMGVSPRFPIAYFQILGYEEVRRPDVLYGFPNVVVSYPLLSLNNPAWFAEGTAQYQRSSMDHDRWDTHRDMMLRTQILEDEAMTLSEMGGFYSKPGILREAVYNHGYAFTRYLAHTRGEEILSDITTELSRFKHWNMERAMSGALGEPAENIYQSWMDTLSISYHRGARELQDSKVEGSILVSEGFANHGPKFSPDGGKLAYVSNQRQPWGKTSLHVYDFAADSLWAYRIGSTSWSGDFCALGNRLKKSVEGAVSWRPDGQAIVYARQRHTPAGYLFNDLFELDLSTGEESRLTKHARASQPAYHPNGTLVAYVGQSDGTTNVFVFDKASGIERQVTSFNDGSHVTEPDWDPQGEWIYFGYRGAGAHERDIWRISVRGDSLEAIVRTDADERSPTFGASEDVLYFASDRSGIFNIYQLQGDEHQALTNVLGGAFMPSVGPDGELAYAHYQWDGYKIAILPEPRSVQALDYSPPEVLLKEAEKEGGAKIAVNVEVADSPELPAASRYGLTTTGFAVYPVLRLDQYVGRRRSVLQRHLPDRSRLEVLSRNLKVGAYASSREILEGITIFGGLLIAPGSRDAASVSDFFAASRMISLERDAFLQFDYRRGFGFIPRRWSPQISVELYNIRRFVGEGLEIEEFPCTACLPETTYADLTYALWEAGVYSRHKISSVLLFEIGYRYSPYRVQTEQFYSKELKQTIPASSPRYFIGRTLLARMYFEALAVHRERDVFPSGLRLQVGLESERGRLLDRFDLDNGVLQPVYDGVRIYRLSTHGMAGAVLPGMVRGASHGLALRWHASSILGQTVDSFYDDYVGGLAAARGYPFYALGGNKVAWLQMSYMMPLFPDIQRQFLWIYLDKAFLRTYADAAAAWSGGWTAASGIRKDIGAELRLILGSYYLLPTAVFVSATYGIDAFDKALDEDFVTPSGRTSIRYGSELRWHFGILFGFDI